MENISLELLFNLQEIKVKIILNQKKFNGITVP